MMDLDDFLNEPRGICPICGQPQSIDEAGDIKQHSITVDGLAMDITDLSDLPDCEGTGKKPQGKIKAHKDWSHDEFHPRVWSVGGDGKLFMKEYK